MNRCPFAPSSLSALLDLDADALRRAPDLHGELRSAGPVVWVPQLDAFAVTTFEAAEEVLLDPERFSNELGDPKGPKVRERMTAARLQLANESETFRRLLERLQPDWRAVKVLTNVDPPRHAGQRRIVNRLFTPRRVQAIAPRAGEIAHSLIDSFVERGSADLAREFCVGLPLQVIAEQLGVGTERLADFKRWSDDVTATLGNDRLEPSDVARITGTLVEFGEHFRPALEDRRRHPQDDFITTVATAQDDEFPISDEHRLGFICAMLGAGNETSTKALSQGAALLAERPDLATRLCADAGLMPRFAEEVLRLAAPVQGLYRTARFDTELAGVPIPEGSSLWVLYASANRTEVEFPNPDEVDLDRPNLHGHLTFGKGIHYCPGAPLARMEVEVGLGALLERIHPWRVVDDEPERSYVLRGFKRLNVEFPPGARRQASP